MTRLTALERERAEIIAEIELRGYVTTNALSEDHRDWLVSAMTLDEVGAKLTREFGSRAAVGASEPTGVDRVIDHSIKPRAAQSMNKVLLIRLPGRSGVKNAKYPV
jgi:hypothetical protein